MNATTCGLDVARQIFQMYRVGSHTGEVSSRRFWHDELVTFLVQGPAGLVALEAYGGAYWCSTPPSPAFAAPPAGRGQPTNSGYR
jgi:transposase